MRHPDAPIVMHWIGYGCCVARCHILSRHDMRAGFDNTRATKLIPACLEYKVHQHYEDYDKTHK
jgi:hypothetical protein